VWNLERFAGVMPVRAGPPSGSLPRVRHSTTRFAALEVAAGKVLHACSERHCDRESGVFLDAAARRGLYVAVTTTPLISGRGAGLPHALYPGASGPRRIDA
jgi:hypothetical protein